MRLACSLSGGTASTGTPFSYRIQPRRDSEIDADDGPAVEEADREQVERVEQEADVGEHDEPRRVVRRADRPDRRRAEAADERACEGDERAPPGRDSLLARRDEGAEARDEGRERHRNSLPPRLEDVTELVHEDQQDEARARTASS